MELLRLSEQMSKAKNPARYYKSFEAAVRAGEFAGVVLLADRAKIPARKAGGKAREVADYAVLPSAEFQAWNERALLLTASTTSAPTFNALKSGAIDFEEAARTTRELLEKKAKRTATLTAQRKAKAGTDKQPEQQE